MHPTDAADYFAKRVATPLDLLEEVVTGEAADAPQGRVLCLGGPAELVCERVLPALLAPDGQPPRLRLIFGTPTSC